MMTRIKSGFLAKIKLLASIPVVILLFIVFSCTKAIDEIPPQITTDFIESSKKEIDGENLTQLSFQFEKDQTLENGIILTGNMNYTLDIKSIPGSKSDAIVRIYSPDKKEIANNLYQDGSVSDKIQFWIEDQGEYIMNVKGQKDQMGSALLLLSYDKINNNSCEKEDVSDQIYTEVEEMPIFKGGGTDEFRRFIQENLVYPIEAAEQGISGKVYLSFVVDVDGSITDIKVERSAHKLLDKEAVRVVKLSHLWVPGKNNGEVVKVQFTFPIQFKLK